MKASIEHGALLTLPEEQQTLHLYHMGGSPLVRSVKMRPPSVKCIACGPNKTIKSLEEYDYEAFCSGLVNESANESVERISAKVCGARLLRRYS